MDPISSINPQSIEPLQVPRMDAASSEQNSFKNLLFESIQQVNSLQQDADRAVEQLFTGQDVNPAEVLTSVQKADLTFRLMMQFRNKLVQAYDEIRNMQI